MTESNVDVAAAEAAMAAAAEHARWCEQVAQKASGSAVVVEQPATIDDIAVDWPRGS